MSQTKLRPSFTFTEERLAELRRVVPEAFSDGRVDWAAMQEALGNYLGSEEDAAEHFGLFWPGKREARRLATTPSRGTLVPAPGEGVDETSSANLFVEGDNLEVLKLLQKSYAGRVKMIYIDPPYNTGNDFVYKDDFRDPIEEYLRKTGQTGEGGEPVSTNTRADGRFHSNWLSMMYPRLLLARQLLREDGVLFVSIDDTEVANLRLVLDEVFGSENFVATIIWQKVFSPKNTARHFSEDHDYIVLYARHADLWSPILLPRSAEADARYSNPDNDPRGPWTSGDLSARNYYSEGTYPVSTPGGRRIPGPPPGTYWRVSRAKFDELNADRRIWWGADGNNTPRLKRFIAEVKQGVVPQTLWKYEDVGHTQEAKKQLLERVTFATSDSVFDTPKPVRLVERMLRIATASGSDDLVVDFFAGSGTTGEAVLKLNRDDGGRRRFILVQLPEITGHDDFRTVAEITKERLRAAARDFGANTPAGPTRGFRVLKLTSSHFRPWRNYDGSSVEELQSLFDSAETPLVDRWTPEGLQTEVILLEGFPLDSRVEKQNRFVHNDVRLVTSADVGHRLWACFDELLHEATLRMLDPREEDVFICLDSALSDEAKIGLADRCTLKTI